MKLKEEWHIAKNKGEPWGPPLFLFEPWRGARVGSHRCPVLRVRLLKCSIPEQTMEKSFDHVTVLIRRLTARESLRLPASSMCPLDLAIPARRIPDYGAAWSPAGRSNRLFRCRALSRPSADATDCPRASTKGRVEARSHTEKNDRTDLVNEDRNTVTGRSGLPTSQ
jgi:hypothetical protein